MKSKFYYGGSYKSVAQKICDHINSSPQLLSPQTAHSPRAAGDAIESVVADKFGSFLGSWCTDYSSNSARRAMADIEFTDRDGFHSLVDVKTHREDTEFNMPNLTSVERLSRLYKSDNKVFSLIIVKYAVSDTAVRATKVTFCPIEFLDWDCLTIGALGWGQIQIANSNNIKLREPYSRKDWMLKLCEAMLQFYPNEISKINERINHFEQIKSD